MTGIYGAGPSHSHTKGVVPPEKTHNNNVSPSSQRPDSSSSTNESLSRTPGFYFAVTAADDDLICAACDGPACMHNLNIRGRKQHEGAVCKSCKGIFIGQCAVGVNPSLGGGEWTCSNPSCKQQQRENTIPRESLPLSGMNPRAESSQYTPYSSQQRNIINMFVGSQPQQPRVFSQEELIDLAALRPRLYLPPVGVPKQRDDQVRQRCIDLLSDVAISSKLLVRVKQVDNRDARVVESELIATLRQKNSIKSYAKSEFIISFDDDDEKLLYDLSKSAQVQRGVWILDFTVILPHEHGLPPASNRGHVIGTPLISVPDTAIFVGIKAGSIGTEAAAAITIRARHVEHGVLWSCAGDYTTHPRVWDGELVMDRAYAGGEPRVMSVIALTAALREAGKHQHRVAIVVEDSAQHAYVLLDALTKGLPLSRDQDKFVKFHSRTMGELLEAYPKVAARTSITQSRYTTTATRRAAASLSHGRRPRFEIDDETLELFPDYVATKADVVALRKMQQQDVIAAAQATTPVELLLKNVEKVKTLSDFVEVARRNKSRTHCPTAAATAFSTAAVAMLKRCCDAEQKSEQKTQAFIALNLLPNQLLPVGGRSSVLQQRINTGVPYNMQFSPDYERQRTVDAITNDAKRRGKDPITAVDEYLEQQDKEEEQHLRHEAYAHLALTNVEFIQLINSVTNPQRFTSAELADNNDYASATRATTTAAAAATDAAVGAQPPAPSAEERIHQLVAAQVFAIRQERAAETMLQKKKTEKTELERLAESVTRLVNDHKISSARKLIENVVEKQLQDDSSRTDMDFKEKTDKLRAKFKTDDNEGLRNLDLRLGEIPRTQPFCKEQVLNVVRRLPTQAASCVDGWNARLIKTVISVQPGAAELFGRLAADICNIAFDDLGMSIIRLGRAVAVPKDNGGVRPISLSSFLLKLAGGCVYNDGPNQIRLQNQYALNRANGTHTVIHHVRQERKDGMAVLRFDCSGAFDNARRTDVLRILFAKDGVIQKFMGANAKNEETTEKNETQKRDKNNNNNDEEDTLEAMVRDFVNEAAGATGAAAAAGGGERKEHGNGDAAEEPIIPDDLSHINSRIANVIRYFIAAYGEGNELAVFGPNGAVEYISMRDGVKQGDTFSSFFYCLVQDLVNARVQRMCPGARIRMFIDDITITCAPRHTWYVVHETAKALAEFGAKINLDKSKVLINSKDKQNLGAYPYPDVTPTEADELTMLNSAREAWTSEAVPDALMQQDFVFGARLVRPQELQRPPLKQRRAKREQIPQPVLDKQRELENMIATNALRFSHHEHIAKCEWLQARSADLVISQDALDATVDMQENVVCENEDFVVLGANISDNYDKYNATQSKRFTRFYELLDMLPLHPQVAFTLMRISAFAKPRYYASVNPPQYTTLADGPLYAFKTAAINALESNLHINVKNSDYVHLASGLGVPNYSTANVVRLYEESRNAATLSLPMQETELVNQLSTGQEEAARPQDAAEATAAPAPSTTDTNGNALDGVNLSELLQMSDEDQRVHATIISNQKNEEMQYTREHRLAQSNALWLLCQPRGHGLLPHEFRFAMAIRCGTLPLDILESQRRPQSCSCHADISTPIRLIRHALCCKRCSYQPTHRHHHLNDAIRRVLSAYGISCMSEPRMFSPYYTDSLQGIQRRPDLTVFVGGQSITTDFSVVQQAGSRPGIAAAIAAVHKRQHHRPAVTKGGSTFIAFTAEAHGITAGCVDTFIEQVSQHLPQHEAAELRRELLLATSISLCRARIQSVMSMAAPDLMVNLDDGQGSDGEHDAADGLAA